MNEILNPEADAQQAGILPAQVEADATVVNVETDADETTNYHNLTKNQLVVELCRIVESGDVNAHKEVALIKQCFYQLRNREIDAELAAFVEEGGAPEAFVSAPDPDEALLKEQLAVFKDKRSEFLAAEEARREENLVAKNEVIAKMQAIVDDIDNINLHFTEFQQLQQEFKDIKEVPATAETNIWKKYQAVVELFYDRLKMNKELRDLDFRKNLESKQALIAEAKKLTDLADVISAFRQLQDLHLQWREIGPVAKEYREDIWNEFKEISAMVNRRHQEFFETRKAEEQVNEDAKTALCEEIDAVKIEDLKSFAAWDEATKKVLDMQARWKSLGFASRKVNTLLFTRFRQACDAFFTAKAEYYKSTKEALAANLEKKTALCDKAEALRNDENLDPKEGLKEIIELQNQWKKIGSVPRKQSDALWQRFTTACNYFFEERKRRQSDTRKEEMANLNAKRDVIAKIKAIPEDLERADAIAQVNELQKEWQGIGHVPFKMKDKLYGEYKEAVDAIYQKYQMQHKQQRMSGFKERLAAMDDDSRLGREQDRLLRALEQKKQELRTFENNLGFFNVKSSSGNSMLQDMERRIARIKDEIEELKSKIDLVDSKMK